MDVEAAQQRDVARPGRSALARALSLTAYPALLTAAPTATWLALSRGASPLQASAMSIAAVWLAVGVLERVLPYRETWRAPLRVWGIDLLHSLVAAQVVLPLVRLTVFAAIIAASANLAQLAGGTLWPDGSPFVLQVACAVLVADLGAYLAHRFMHVTRLGWRLHAVHHSPTRLDFLAAGRAHPFNAALTLSCENGLLILLGAPPEVLVVFSVYKGTNGLLQHANVDFRTGALGAVLATQEAHRWHHSLALRESNTNFGNTTLVWDRLFGTVFLPRDRRGPEQLGIDNAEIPEDYLVHLQVPFTLARFERER